MSFVRSTQWVTVALAAIFVTSGVVAAPPQAMIEVRDDSGAAVRLNAPAQRIVSMSPAATETLFAIDAGTQVVGTVAYSNWPEAAKRIPRIGDAFGINREAIIAAQPDLAIVWGSGIPAQRIAELRSFGAPVYVTEPRTVEEIATTIERFGALTGHLDTAWTRAKEFRAQVAALRSRYASRTRLDVFFQIASSPLMTINGAHFFSQALEICGANNVFASLPQLAPQISAEAVIAADPQIIVALGDGGESRSLDRWKALSGLRATRQSAFVVTGSNALARTSPAFVDAVNDLCERLDAVRVRLAAQPR